MNTVGILILIIIAIFIIVVIATFFFHVRLFIIFPTSQGLDTEKSSNGMLSSWRLSSYDVLPEQ
jgi:hypothetical protein